MVVRRRRLLLLALLVVVDVATLSLLTAWVVRRPSAVVAGRPTPPGGPAAAATNATAANATAATPGITARPPPPRATSASDRKLTGGPKFGLAATVDHDGNVWVGTEDQGVWCSQGDDNWLSYSTADGLADADATALACDARGRLWVGHADHGLSVYNGQAWRTYDRFAGPGASHVFCLATCPTDGDVWMGTDAGLARYSLKGDTWTTYDRSTGVPGAQVTCLAFDSAGNLFAGLGGEGVGMAKAADGYAAWTHVSGPDDLPIVASGPGLPSPLVNAVLVARPDDAVYVGTCHGLARSVDHGVTWAYVRGRNWPQLSKGRYDGVPAGFAGTPAGPLLEDWVSALAQDAAGVLWVGYREAGFQAFPDLAAKADYAGKGRVAALAVRPDGTVVIATYGEGAVECGTTYAAAVPAAPPAAGTTTDAFPTSTPAAAGAELDALRKQVEALPPGKDGVDFLGDDWDTMGDWCGRYGRQVADLVNYHTFAEEPGYAVGLGVGPYRAAIPRYQWDNGAKTDRGQLDPRDGSRVFCEMNDESYNAVTHPRSQQGPDMYVAVTVPGGVHRVGLYYHNSDGHNGANVWRDYGISVRRSDGEGEGSEGVGYNTARENVIAAELAPTLVRTRVSRFWRPVFKRFLIRGAGTYWFRAERNGSFCTKAFGVYVDRLDGPAADAVAYPHPPSAKDYTADPGTKGAAARLWAALDAAVGRQGYAAVAGRGRNAAYYAAAAAAAGVDPDTLARWRYQMPMWLGDDRDEFDRWVKSIPPPPKAK